MGFWVLGVLLVEGFERLHLLIAAAHSCDGTEGSWKGNFSEIALSSPCKCA